MTVGKILSGLIADLRDPHDNPRAVRIRWWIHIVFGTLGWLAVVATWPYAQNVPRYALY